MFELRRWNSPALRTWLAIGACAAAARWMRSDDMRIGFVIGWLAALAIAALREADHD